MRLDREWEIAAYAYRSAKLALDEAKARFDDAKDALVALAGDSEESGFDVAVKWQKRKGSIDYQSALESVAPDMNVEPFRKPETVFPVIKIIGE